MNRGLKLSSEGDVEGPSDHINNLAPMNRGLKRDVVYQCCVVHRLINNLAPMNRGLKPTGVGLGGTGVAD